MDLELHGCGRANRRPRRVRSRRDSAGAAATDRDDLRLQHGNGGGAGPRGSHCRHRGLHALSAGGFEQAAGRRPARIFGGCDRERAAGPRRRHAGAAGRPPARRSDGTDRRADHRPDAAERAGDSRQYSPARTRGGSAGPGRRIGGAARGSPREHRATDERPRAATRGHDHRTAGERPPTGRASRHLYRRRHRARRRTFRARGPRSDRPGLARGRSRRRPGCAALRRLVGAARRADRASGLERDAGGHDEARLRREPRRAADPWTAHHRRHRARGGAVAPDGTDAMRVWLSLVLILGAAIVLAACAGHDWASPLDLARALAGDTDMRSRLLVEWRMPRVLASALVGVLLGIGGAVFQGVFRNPLAEPYLLGSAGGAALGATVALLVPLGLPQSWLLPALAFAGAWGATVLVIAVSRVAGAVAAAGLLLAGVAVAAILGALRSFFMLALSDETVSLQVVLSWVLGGVQTPTWTTLGLFAVISAACLGLTMLFARGLDVLGLGETMAVGFGLEVKRFVAFAVLSASIVVAAAVAFGGLVAFVGLAAPHIARWLVGPMHRLVLPASALVGACIVTIADAIARSALPPSEIPLGLVTAVAGGPFFIVLLARRLRA